MIGTESAALREPHGGGRKPAPRYLVTACTHNTTPTCQNAACKETHSPVVSSFLSVEMKGKESPTIVQYFFFSVHMVLCDSNLELIVQVLSVPVNAPLVLGSK